MDNRLHLVELVRKLMDSEGTEAELDDMFDGATAAGTSRGDQ